MSSAVEAAGTHVGGLALALEVLLVRPHGLEAGGAAAISDTSMVNVAESDSPDELVRELGLVMLVVGIDVAAVSAAAVASARADARQAAQCWTRHVAEPRPRGIIPDTRASAGTHGEHSLDLVSARSVAVEEVEESHVGGGK